jgi:hypothetical protein
MRFQNSISGMEFDDEKGCRRCYLVESRRNKVKLTPERLCERCAAHVAVDYSGLTDEVLERIFGGDLAR